MYVHSRSNIFPGIVITLLYFRPGEQQPDCDTIQDTIELIPQIINATSFIDPAYVCLLRFHELKNV